MASACDGKFKAVHKKYHIQCLLSGAAKLETNNPVMSGCRIAPDTHRLRYFLTMLCWHKKQRHQGKPETRVWILEPSSKPLENDTGLFLAFSGHWVGPLIKGGQSS